MSAKEATCEKEYILYIILSYEVQEDAELLSGRR